MSSKMDKDLQLQFLHLFERVGEPLSFSPRGEGDNMVIYRVDSSAISCAAMAVASRETQSAFQSMQTRTVQIPRPATMPNLQQVAQLCPRTVIYNNFNPRHRESMRDLRDLLMKQTNARDLFAMCCACRDNSMINCKLFVNAFYSCMLTHPQVMNKFQLPSVWEVMPDQFFGTFPMRQALRQASLPRDGRAIIDATELQTGRLSKPENRLSYWREDVGVNSHHWHWHLVYRIEDPPSPGRRKGELFYFMHHSILARYNAERLGHGLQRTKPMDLNDTPVVKEGYFSKLTDTSSGQNWGTRQSDTPLRNLNRQDPDLPPTLGTSTLQEVRKWRDRVLEAVDTGMVIGRNNQRTPLNIDILGDILEGSDLNPNPQFYGQLGIHNVGHGLIAFAHDPEHKHLENAGPMYETTTAMRDPAFYTLHTYIDVLFDMYKMTLRPYQEKGGEFPLAWPDVRVTNISVQHTQFGSKVDSLRTFFQQNYVDMSRGLDFFRTNQNQLGPVWLRFTHLNHEPFNYTINVRNMARSNVRATVRIYIAPRLNEDGQRFSMSMQRKLFFEMDKFVQELRPGDNTITRRSTDSDLTIPWDQTFSDIERNVMVPSAQQSICRCGWPQHMLLPRGSPSGQLFDLVVFLTNAAEDEVPGTRPPPPQANCRESLTFCGRLNQPYPDRKPMGYPYDRNVFTIPDPMNPKGPQIPVGSLEEYVSRIPNMKASQVKIEHDTKLRPAPQGRGPSGNMSVVSGDPTARSLGRTCAETQGRPSVQPPRTSGRPMETAGRPGSPPPRTYPYGGRQPGSGRPSWGTGSRSGRSHYGEEMEGSPESPRGWSRVSSSRPGSPNWGWGDGE